MEKLAVVTTRLLEPGVELLLNYGHDHRLVCRCGGDACRQERSSRHK
jgi:hypothetical protein